MYMYMYMMYRYRYRYTEHTHIGRSDRQSASLTSKTSTTKQEMQTSGKILRSTRRSLATDAVSELARSIPPPCFVVA